MANKLHFSVGEVADAMGVCSKTVERRLKDKSVPAPAINRPRCRLWSWDQIQQIRELRQRRNG